MFLPYRKKAKPNLGVVSARNFLEQTVYPALCEGLAVVGRPLLLSRAEDMTSQTATRSCLVLAPPNIAPALSWS